MCLPFHSFAPSPFPLPRRGLVHTFFAHAQNIPLYCKKLHALPCPYAEDYTNQEYRAFFEIHSSDENLLRYFSGASIIFTNLEGNKSIYQKGALVAKRVAIETLVYMYLSAHGL